MYEDRGRLAEDSRMGGGSCDNDISLSGFGITWGADRAPLRASIRTLPGVKMEISVKAMFSQTPEESTIMKEENVFCLC